MASLHLTAGGLLFIIILLKIQGNVIRDQEYEVPEQYPEIHSPDPDDAEDDPSQLLAYIHSPSDKECSVHQLSRNLLFITKDLISFEPRTKSDYRMSTEQKLSSLLTLKPQDVKAILSHNSLSVPEFHNITCGPDTLYYRTMDGSCNNFQRPCWGKSDEPYQRWLPPAYANGIDEPRRMKSGLPLPNPRDVYLWVSSQFEPSGATTYPSFNNLLVVWGQMVAHDMLLTPSVTVKVWDGKEFKNEKPHCCKAGVNPHPECFPIVTNHADGFYSQGHCLDVARSSAYVHSPYSCSPLKLGKTREQMNQLSSFIDGSIVYGVTEEHMRTLRENGGFGAKLLMDSSSGWSFLTRKNASFCKTLSNLCSKKCFLAGEKRVNESPVLATMHTLWAREHNRLVDMLRVKGWSEEMLFHVVRKIIGAMLQHTTYKEYLPLILGPTLAKALKLTVPSENYKYDPSVNPTMYNSFATAAFRYGHSMVSTRHVRAGKGLQDSPLLSQDFFSVDDFCSFQTDPVSSVLFGQVHQNVQKIDCLFSKQLTNHLFAKEANGKGMDLFSINIQRGRDHGLPPYNEWRKVCGLPAAKDYSDLRGIIPDYIIERLETIYGPGNVDEIDLYVGGIAELPVNDGILGPTFTCIVANQFYSLKVGDRFWYENHDNPGAFSSDQIASIQKTTIASLICRNTDIREIPQMALLLESEQNPKISCRDILQQTDLDVRLW